MSMIRFLISLGISIFLLISCQQATEQKDSGTIEVAVEPVTGLPPIPPSVLADWQSRVHRVDFIFFTVNVSIVTHEKDAVNTLAFFESVMPVIPEHCKPDGRMFAIDVNGDTVCEIDFSIASGCRHGIAYVDGKPAYASNISNTGLQQFANLLRNVPGLEVQRTH